MVKRITYSFWGNDKKEHNWIDWYYDVKCLFHDFGYELSHVSVDFELYNPPKILTVKRKEKEIIHLMENGEIPKSFECFSLPNGFKTATFDYDIYCVRNNKYISYSLYENIMDEKNEDRIIQITNKYFIPENGEVFLSSIDEVPLLYVATKNKHNVKSYEYVKSL